jgi:NAD(P)-dependent dehydrogenase (short-subunit alcohol dehydrogenase family)
MIIPVVRMRKRNYCKVQPRNSRRSCLAHAIRPCLQVIRAGWVLVPRGPERIATLTAGLPLPRAATPAEAAQAYVYLMLNGYITGQILPVDGGGSLV